MAVATESSQLKSELKCTMYRNIAASATDVDWVDMKDYDSILIGVSASLLVGAGVTVFKILGNSEFDGGGTDVEIKAKAIPPAPDALEDTLWLEATAEEIAGASTVASGRLRYVSANITAANAGDIASTVYIRRSRRPAKDETADVIA